MVTVQLVGRRDAETAQVERSVRRVESALFHPPGLDDHSDGTELVLRRTAPLLLVETGVMNAVLAALAAHPKWSPTGGGDTGASVEVVARSYVSGP
jgi:hypothetical protein